MAFATPPYYLLHWHLTVFQSKVIPCLLRLRNSHNSAVAESAREALALVGYVDAVSGRGVRVLSLDGGGTKYVPISNLIDFIDQFTDTIHSAAW